VDDVGLPRTERRQTNRKQGIENECRENRTIFSRKYFTRSEIGLRKRNGGKETMVKKNKDESGCGCETGQGDVSY